ncbi:hypothetical protein OPIT5_29390 [Opitutaceae bacterium TAV5]|nr:hypothetical protein OPIT5_21730 [Opitutaceae bacterium TAV5]AHF94893.1 hypothetical protein OPIT5_29390 [Opitutaceae bacterium TAV5]
MSAATEIPEPLRAALAAIVQDAVGKLVGDIVSGLVRVGGPSGAAGDALVPAALGAIASVVMAHYGITPEQMRSRCRTATLAEARHVYYHLAVTLTRYNHDLIARAIAHGRCSCTHSVDRIAGLIEVEKRLAATVEMLRVRATLALAGLPSGHPAR